METSDGFRCKLKIEGSGYKLYPWVHISRLKPRALFPNRPTEDVEVAEEDDFDAAILPEDVDGPDEAQNEYEVENIRDVRWVKRSRTSRRVREYLVKWKGYSELEWLPVSQLNCGALLYEFNQGAKAQARFRAMQAGDELPGSDAQ
ncbi:reverse transcriptase [Phytophthora cinnamomi]|uniref:reverse transcriptase n=1 Tax=Phytophthora cinnamomi TaxID=4785 RepID=UPI00355A4EC4|nr:reverse transcriptase [Phytophthora cinnamomi]